VLAAVEAAGFEPNLGNTAWWAGREKHRETFTAGEAGFHVDRAALERVLVAAAEAIGVNVLLGMSARSAQEGEDGWTVTCEGGDGGRFDVHAPWVIDATGRHGLLARAYREPDRSTTTLALARRYRRAGGWGEETRGHTLIESFENGWAWSVPLSEEVRCVTVMVDQRHTDFDGQDVAAWFEAELAGAVHIRATLIDATPDGDAWACPAALYSASQYGRAGLLLAGDAGSFIDPLSSYGVKKALASGWLAGIVAHTALIDPALTEPAVAFHDARERAVYQSYRARSATFFQEAADAHGHAYWSSRAKAALAAAGHSGPEGARPDEIGDLLDSPISKDEVQRAFETLRSRETLAAVPGATLRTMERASIRGHRIFMTEHYASDALPEGMRYAHNVDLGTVLRLAPEHADVPGLWTAYNAESPPVPLPDFLTGLSTAFAAGLLEHSDG